MVRDVTGLFFSERGGGSRGRRSRTTDSMKKSSFGKRIVFELHKKFSECHEIQKFKRYAKDCEFIVSGSSKSC